MIMFFVFYDKIAVLMKYTKNSFCEELGRSIVHATTELAACSVGWVTV